MSDLEDLTALVDLVAFVGPSMISWMSVPCLEAVKSFLAAIVSASSSGDMCKQLSVQPSNAARGVVCLALAGSSVYDMRQIKPPKLHFRKILRSLGMILE